MHIEIRSLEILHQDTEIVYVARLMILSNLQGCRICNTATP
jgi:hypothetical protein